MTAYRFWSDANQAYFEQQLHGRGVAYDRNGFDVHPHEDQTWMEEAALALGATLLKEDDPSPFLDIGATAIRSNPPKEIADPSPAQLLANISQTIAAKNGRKPMKKTQRRATRGQPRSL